MRQNRSKRLISARASERNCETKKLSASRGFAPDSWPGALPLDPAGGTAHKPPIFPPKASSFPKKLGMCRTATERAVVASLWALFRLDALALSVIATATWLGGWVGATLRYCNKTAKPIRKRFRPSESPVTLVSWDPCGDTKFHGEPLQRGR